ncbi:MAG: hypothetical protein AAFY76_07635, partial [Cyanobacteria bacterium J06649_11]
ARASFKDSQVNITTEGKRHLGAAIGSNSYKKCYVRGKVYELTEQLKILSKIDIIFLKKRYNQDLLKLRQSAASRAVTHANNTAINS